MSITFEIHEKLAAPREAVYEAMTDIESFGEWMPNFVAVERLNDAEGVGTKWRETRKMFGMEATEIFEVTGLEPGRAVELYVDGTQGSSRKGFYKFRYELTDTDEGGTEMVVYCEVGGLGPVANFMGRLFSGGMKKAFVKDLRAMGEYAAKK